MIFVIWIWEILGDDIHIPVEELRVFTHKIRTKERKFIRHTTIKKSFYGRKSYLAFTKNYLVVIIFTEQFCFITMISIY
jgi:hypothetical protein